MTWRPAGSSRAARAAARRWTPARSTRTPRSTRAASTPRPRWPRSTSAPPGPARPAASRSRCATTTCTGRGCPGTRPYCGRGRDLPVGAGSRPGPAGIRGRRPAPRLRPRARRRRRQPAGPATRPAPDSGPYNVASGRPTTVGTMAAALTRRDGRPGAGRHRAVPGRRRAPHRRLARSGPPTNSASARRPVRPRGSPTSPVRPCGHDDDRDGAAGRDAGRRDAGRSDRGRCRAGPRAGRRGHRVGRADGQRDGLRTGSPRRCSAGWLPHAGPGTPVALAAGGAGGVAWARDSRRACRGGGCSPRPTLAALGWTLSLALVDGWQRGFAGRLTTQTEYLTEVAGVTTPCDAARFAARILDSSPDSWTTHVAGHPPGALLVFVALDRIGLGGGAWAAFGCVAGRGARRGRRPGDAARARRRGGGPGGRAVPGPVPRRGVDRGVRRRPVRRRNRERDQRCSPPG